jgi:serine phosphatase RsbU (regulator of sigma subunit)/anti-sigma regulatory factor (Ser/Thr protein kinase)
MPESAKHHLLMLESGLAAAGEASIWARTLAAQHGVPAERTGNLDLCIIELINNVVDYAYGGGPGEIELELMVSPETLLLTVADSGPAFNPLDLAPPTQASSLDDARVGGLGVHLVRQFADVCHYERRQKKNFFTAGFGDVQELPRRVDRRRSGLNGFPLERADGALITDEQRSDIDRRSLGFISRCDLFRDVPYMALEEILGHCRLVEYPAGAVVLRADEPLHSVLVVVKGSLRVHLGGPNSEDAVDIPTGQCVGELSVADGKPASAWVVTAEATLLLVIEGPVFLERLLAIPRIGRNLIVMLAERMRRGNERIVARIRGAMELEALQRELDFARRIQASMLPGNPLLAGASGLDCHGFMRAARQVGGDFYDVLPQGPDRFFFAIGDVCNKGMPAALFMVQALTLLRSEAARREQDPGAQLAGLARHVNDQLAASNEAQLFVSVFCAILDLDSGFLHYVNIGHNAPLIELPGAAPVFLEQPRNPIAGMVPDLAFKVGRIAFPSGSRLLLYTDGVTEAEAVDAAQFGEEAMQQLLAGSRSDVAGTVQGIVAAVDNFAGSQPQSDDITLLLIRRC